LSTIINNSDWLTILSVTAKVSTKVSILLLKRKKTLRVDLKELEGERDALSAFLRSKLNVDVTASSSELWINSESLPSNELKRFVDKFVYRRNLMNQYWVALKGNTVKIKKLKRSKKHEKQKGTETPPSTIKHGW
jgi:hypothetical protein